MREKAGQTEERAVWMETDICERSPTKDDGSLISQTDIVVELPKKRTDSLTFPLPHSLLFIFFFLSLSLPPSPSVARSPSSSGMAEA